MRPGRRSRSGSFAGRVLVSVVALALAVVITALDLPAAFGGFMPQVDNSNNTAATSAYFTCRNAVTGAPGTPAYFAYPLGESSGLVAADATGNNRTGQYHTSGVNYGVANPAATGVCPRDGRTVISLNGITGYVSGPATAMANPTVFSTEIWFKTTQAQGKLIGFGNNRTGSSSVNNYDRHTYIDDNGFLRFGVFPNSTIGRFTIVSAKRVNDDKWHQAIATLSGDGMALYLDGELVKLEQGVTSARNYTGYWRIGYDDLSLWPDRPLEHFEGSLAYAAVYTFALSPSQVKAHYNSGR